MTLGQTDTSGDVWVAPRTRGTLPPHRIARRVLARSPHQPRMHTARRLGPAAALLVSLVLAPAAPAQYTLSQVQLPTGARVRVTAPTLLPERVVGRVIARTPDGLAISKDQGRVQVSFAPEQIEMLEVSEGRQRLRWSVLGGLGGMVAGGSIGAWQGGRNDPSGFGAALGLIGGSMVGLLAGAISGAILAPERWERYLFSGTR